jgi:hypothetical protein
VNGIQTESCVLVPYMNQHQLKQNADEKKVYKAKRKKVDIAMRKLTTWKPKLSKISTSVFIFDRKLQTEIRL